VVPEVLSEVSPVAFDVNATQIPPRETEGFALPLGVDDDAVMVMPVVPEVVVDVVLLVVEEDVVVAEVVVPACGLLTSVIAPLRRSRTKTFVPPLEELVPEVVLPVVPEVVPPEVEPSVRLVARESKATKRPSDDIAGL
jgi:hypothetical protein